MILTHCEALSTYGYPILSIILFFIDGMLLYAIGFFVLFLMLGLMKAMWGVSVWADNTTRRMGGEE